MFKIGDLVKQRIDCYSHYSYGCVRSTFKRYNGFGQVVAFKQEKLCLILDVKQHDDNHSIELKFFVDNKILYANSCVFERV